jgi:hypothetical protein
MIEDDNDPMQDAIKLLVTRMEHYPEEFTVTKGRFWEFWEQLHRARAAAAANGPDPMWFMSPAEKEQLLLGARKLMRQVYVQQVMSKLVEPEEMQLTASGHLKTMGLGGAMQRREAAITTQEYEPYNRQTYEQYKQRARQRLGQEDDDVYDALRHAYITQINSKVP